MVHVVLLPRSRTTTLVGAAAMLPPLEYMAGLELTDGPVRPLSFYNLVGRARALSRQFLLLLTLLYYYDAAHLVQHNSIGILNRI